MTQIRSTKTKVTRTSLIAPCGMNCRLCMAYGREKKACPGCRGDDSFKSKSCLACRIKNCEMLAKGKFKYCFSCDSFPCDRMKHLDKRYRTKYGMSMVGNLNHIEKHGIRQFIRSEEERWSCPKCGETICVHRPECPACGRKWR